MSLTAEGYFNCLREYLNDKYKVAARDGGRIVLEEKVYWPGIEKPKDQKVRLAYKGDAIVVRLDKKNPLGNSDPLFHFLEDGSKPWAKRCDFVIFQLIRNSLNIYCIEFKSGSLPESLVDQLEASEAWCRSLHGIIKSYTTKTKKLTLRKYVFSSMDDPSPYLNANGYLKRDHTIRHFHYDELRGLSLEQLENANVEILG
jgi:hypothetical protein